MELSQTDRDALARPAKSSDARKLMSLLKQQSGGVQQAAQAAAAGDPSQLMEMMDRLVALGFPCEAKLVQEGLPQKELKKVRRMLVEYGLSRWDMTYILPADKSLHNKIKKKEEK